MRSIQTLIALALMIAPTFLYAENRPPRCSNSLPNPSPNSTPSPLLLREVDFARFAKGSHTVSRGAFDDDTQSYFQHTTYQERSSLWNAAIVVTAVSTKDDKVTSSAYQEERTTGSSSTKRTSTSIIEVFVNGQRIKSYHGPSGSSPDGIDQMIRMSSPLKIDAPGYQYKTVTAIQSAPFKDLPGVVIRGKIVSTCTAHINFGCLKAVASFWDPISNKNILTYDTIKEGVSFLPNADALALKSGIVDYPFTIVDVCK